MSLRSPSTAPLHVKRRRAAMFLLGALGVALALSMENRSREGLPFSALREARLEASGPSSPNGASSNSEPRGSGAIRSTGRLLAAPPGPEKPSSGKGLGFAVEVEQGVPVQPAAFGRAVERTLLDKRGWTAGETYSLHPTNADKASLRVTLASPKTTDELCAPLDTKGIYSCFQDGRAVLNARRWIEGVEFYPNDLGGYRQYMVNHEVGHALGEDHLGCPDAGGPAPIMMQQTKGLGGCQPNPWPLDWER